MTSESTPPAALPEDDPRRALLVVDPDDQDLTHLGLVGDTYTILVSGADTDGRYCLIDMLIPPGGGPGPHRHDFEEMFTVLEGTVTFTFRGRATEVRSGTTVNIPANAPHFFRNTSDGPVRMLCLCAPAGQEEFFTAVGDPVASRTAPAPQLAADDRARKLEEFGRLAPRYRTELVN